MLSHTALRCAAAENARHGFITAVRAVQQAEAQRKAQTCRQVVASVADIARWADRRVTEECRTLSSAAAEWVEKELTGHLPRVCTARDINTLVAALPRLRHCLSPEQLACAAQSVTARIDEPFMRHHMPAAALTNLLRLEHLASMPSVTPTVLHIAEHDPLALLSPHGANHVGSADPRAVHHLYTEVVQLHDDPARLCESVARVLLGALQQEQEQEQGQDLPTLVACASFLLFAQTLSGAQCDLQRVAQPVAALKAAFIVEMLSHCSSGVSASCVRQYPAEALVLLRCAALLRQARHAAPAHSSRARQVSDSLLLDMLQTRGVYRVQRLAAALRCMPAGEAGGAAVVALTSHLHAVAAAVGTEGGGGAASAVLLDKLQLAHATSVVAWVQGVSDPTGGDTRRLQDACRAFYASTVGCGLCEVPHDLSVVASHLRVVHGMGVQVPREVVSAFAACVGRFVGQRARGKGDVSSATLVEVVLAALLHSGVTPDLQPLLVYAVHRDIIGAAPPSDLAQLIRIIAQSPTQTPGHAKFMRYAMKKLKAEGVFPL